VAEVTGCYQAEERKRFKQGELSAEMALLHREDAMSRTILNRWCRRTQAVRACRKEFALRCRLHVLSTRLVVAMQNHARLHEQVKGLEVKNREVESTAREAQSKVVALSGRLQAVHDRTSTLQGEKAQLEEKLVVSRAESEGLRMQVVDLKNEIADLMAQFATLKEVLQEAETRAAAAKVGEEEARKEMEKELVKLKETEKHVADLLIDKEMWERRATVTATSPLGS